jgi:hypothetical protein
LTDRKNLMTLNTQDSTDAAASSPDQPQDLQHRLLNPIGYVLGISYPLLALSTGARAVYQLFFKEGVTNRLAPALTMVSATLYLVAAIGFFSRKPRAWRISVAALTIETIGVLIVGTLSILQPDVIGHTAWSNFGQDYGYFPLIQPLLGLAWLLWKPTRRAYGVAR